MYDSPDPLAAIPPGANKVQVSAALGAPTRIVAEGDREAWLYCRESAVLDHFVLAVFKGPALEKLSQDTDFEFGACEAFFDGVKLGSSGG